MKFCFSETRILVCAVFLASAVAVSAQTTNLPLKEIAPAVFQLGSVRLDKERKTIQFPATINMTNGLIEYFVVTGTGKLHESLLKTETEPSQIHVAMLLIGGNNSASNATGTNISGDNIRVEVSWKTNSVEQRIRAEELIFNSETKSPMNKSYWLYNGSKVIDGTFIAQRDGSIISIIADPLALANSSQPSRNNDEIWSVNTNVVPPLNAAVEVTLKLESQNNGKDSKN